MVEMSQSVSALPMNMIDKDPALQWKWHEAYRDMNKNMYRTSYTDATHFRETYVRSDFPAGYGGHIPSIRHDILHRNTEFDRKQACMRQDPSRDSMVSFNDQISGVPTVTKYPCGAKKNPTKGVSLHDGTTRPLAPWGITVNPAREMPNQRSIPATILRARSTPMLQQAGSRMAGGDSSGSSPARLQQKQQQQQQGEDSGAFFVVPAAAAWELPVGLTLPAQWLPQAAPAAEMCGVSSGVWFSDGSLPPLPAAEMWPPSVGWFAGADDSPPSPATFLLRKGSRLRLRPGFFPSPQSVVGTA